MPPHSTTRRLDHQAHLGWLFRVQYFDTDLCHAKVSSLAEFKRRLSASIHGLTPSKQSPLGHSTRMGCLLDQPRVQKCTFNIHDQPVTTRPTNSWHCSNQRHRKMLKPAILATRNQSRSRALRHCSSSSASVIPCIYDSVLARTQLRVSSS